MIVDNVLVAHQPYFFPWLGYFNKLAYATDFLVLDDAQYRSGFYHNRASIRNSSGKKCWMTIPVSIPHRCSILDVNVSHTFKIEKIDNLVWEAYHKSPFCDILWPDMRRKIVESAPAIVDINISIIRHVISLLELPLPKIHFSSVGKPFPDATSRLLYGCDLTQAQWMIMGTGGSLVCHNLDTIKNSGVKIIIQNFSGKHPQYPQYKNSFIPNLSILDALMCVGIEKTREMVLYDEVFTPNIKMYKK